MRKGSVATQQGTSSGHMKTRNEFPSSGGNKFIDKKQMSKKSPYLKDSSIWEARTDA